MIVKEVRGKDKLLVIHYYSKTDREDTVAILEQEYTVAAEKVYLVVYDPSKVKHIYTGEEAVARAESRLGTGRGEYSLISNNCEHFCTFVKTGNKESLQVQKVAAGAAVVAGVGLAFVGYTVFSALSKETEPKKPVKGSTGKPSDAPKKQ
jgi:hypothetical protein